MKYLQNRESFSFSTSSKTGLFSDDEDVDADDHNHSEPRVSGHHQNDYFEISLPPPPPSPSTTKTNHSDPKEEEFEFCFSFNSSSTLIDFPTTPISDSINHPFHHHDPPMTTNTFATSQPANVVDKKHNHHNKNNKSINYKRILQSASSPRCHQGLISPYNFPSSRLRSFDETQRNLIKNRNSTRLGGIRKFLVKIRSIKSMLRSSLNASRRLQPAKVKANKKNNRTSIDHKQGEFRHITYQSRDNTNVVVNDCSERGNRGEEKSSRRMNFYGFSKMFDVIMRNIGTTRRSNQTDSKSCPVSIKSSPIHDPNGGNGRDERRNSSYSRDHSIQAAIAHCKKSFGK